MTSKQKLLSETIVKLVRKHLPYMDKENAIKYALTDIGVYRSYDMKNLFWAEAENCLKRVMSK